MEKTEYGYEGGVSFNYERIEQPSGAVTFMGAKTTEITGLIDQVTILGEVGDPDVTDNTDPPPTGLPKPKNYRIPHVITPLAPEKTLEDNGESAVVAPEVQI